MASSRVDDAIAKIGLKHLYLASQSSLDLASAIPALEHGVTAPGALDYFSIV